MLWLGRGIHTGQVSSYAELWKTLSNDLARILTAPRVDWRSRFSVIFLHLAGSLATGLAIGVGIAVGRAIAG